MDRLLWCVACKCYDRRSQIAHLTPLHMSDDPGEAARIHAAGGFACHAISCWAADTGHVSTVAGVRVSRAFGDYDRKQNRRLQLWEQQARHCPAHHTLTGADGQRARHPRGAAQRPGPVRAAGLCRSEPRRPARASGAPRAQGVRAAVT